MNPVYKTLRALAWALYFNLGASLISMTQVLSLPLAVIAPGVYRRHINRTEGHFGAFLLKMNQLFAPSDIVLTGDESIRGIVKVYKGRRLQHGKDGKDDDKVKDEETYGEEETILDMPERMIFISNHQVNATIAYAFVLFALALNWACFFTFSKMQQQEKNRGRHVMRKDSKKWIFVQVTFLLTHLFLSSLLDDDDNRFTRTGCIFGASHTLQRSIEPSRLFSGAT